RERGVVECVLVRGVAPGADGPERARAYVANYARVPDYARSLRLQGFGEEVDAIAAAATEGAGPAPVASPAMAEALILTPDREDGPTALAAYEAAGVETILLLPLRSGASPASPFENAEMVLRTFAPTRGDPDMPAGGHRSPLEP